MDNKLKDELLSAQTFLEFNKVILREKIPKDEWQSDDDIMERFNYFRSLVPPPRPFYIDYFEKKEHSD